MSTACAPHPTHCPLNGDDTGSGDATQSGDDAKWQIVLDRDASHAGAFFIAVKTTGIYCRPGCPARTPKRENVRFLNTAADCRAAGFRACKRCHPDAVCTEETA